MTSTPDIDVRDLDSVRAAGKRSDGANVVLGDDWVAPDSIVEKEMQRDRERRGIISIKRSPIARKIIMFNLIALMVLVAGVLYLNPSRDSLAYQRATTLVSEARLVAEVIEAEIPGTAPVNMFTGDGIDIVETLAAIELRNGVEALVFEPGGTLMASKTGALPTEMEVDGLSRNMGGTVLTDFLNSVWDTIALVLSPTQPDQVAGTTAERVFPIVDGALQGRTLVRSVRDQNDSTILWWRHPFSKARG